MAHIIGTISLSKNVYSLYDIAKFENINKDKIESLMSATLKNIVLSTDNHSASGIEAFFNAYGVNDFNINKFVSHGKLRPFAKAIRLATEKCYRNKKEIYYAMFYVPKNVYNDWKKRNKPYNNKISDNMDEYGLPKKVINTRSISFPKNNPELQHFECVVKSLGFKTSEAIMLALNEYMERHSDVFGKIPHNEIDENKVRENKTSLIFAYIDPEIASLVFKFIQRYNMVNTPFIKLSELVEVALSEKLDRLPIKYTHPELYKEQLEIEKAETEFMQKLDNQ